MGLECDQPGAGRVFGHGLLSWAWGCSIGHEDALQALGNSLWH